MKISCLVPTYRRPDDLRRCIRALAAQTRSVDELVVVIRAGDAASDDVLRDSELQLAQRLVRVVVTVPGVIAAMTAGLQAASGEVICLLDDDAVPHADWLARIEHTFKRDPYIGGVG